MDATAEMSAPELMEHAVSTKSEAARDAILERIDEKTRGVRKALDAGVAPDEYKRLESVRSALEVAHKVVTRACAAPNQT